MTTTGTAPPSRLENALAAMSLSRRIFRRTLGAKYRKSFLGYFWMVAPALLITAGVTLAAQAGVVSTGETALPLALHVFLGTLLWQIFAEGLEVPHRAFESARGYLTRVNFPREAILLAQLYESLLTATVRLVLVLILVVAMAGIQVVDALFVTFCFYSAILLGLGIGALLMPFTQLFADLHHALRVVITYGLFLTPAMYEVAGDGLFATLVAANPVTPLMIAAREAASGASISDPGAVIGIVGLGALTSVAGFLLVRAVAPIVIERMLLGGR